MIGTTTKTLLLLERLEHLRLRHCLALARGTSGRRHQRPLGPEILPASQSFQAGQVLEVPQRYPDHHGKHHRRAVQPGIRTIVTLLQEAFYDEPITIQENLGAMV